MKFKKILTAFLLAAFSFSILANSDFDKGVVEYENNNFSKAVVYFKKAAEQGHTFAQFSLGDMYNKGLGVPQDYKQAVAWYRKSAEQGYVSAQLNLGSMYAKGQGVPKDDKQAYIWFSIAAISGDSPAVKIRDIIEKQFSHEELSKAQKEAVVLYEKISANTK